MSKVAVVGLVALFVLSCYSASTEFRVGVGIYDVTGPPSEVNMMGMGQTAQRTHGLHNRLRSRALIVEDVASSQRVVYVTNNLCMTYGDMMQNITALLQQKYGNLYTYANLMISGEHTHSGPAGYTYMTLYDVTSLGFHLDNFNTIVNGIVNAITMAHDNLQDGRILINNGTLLDTSANRSPYSYGFNPQWEQDMYEYDTDKNMTVLRIENAAGQDIGMFTWFAVHGTSMNNTNELISGDNKGYASYYVEQIKNGNNTMPGMGPYVAGFGQCNEGDVSPNTKGASCPDGSPCDARSSTCPGPDGKPRVEGCIAPGPGNDMFDSTQIIGQQQAEFAMHLVDTATIELTGGFGYSHTFIDAQNITVLANYTTTGVTSSTCRAALGDSFAAGTTDGPGEFNFVQGTNDTKTNRFWNKLAYLVLSEPTQDEMDCQYPKPILLNLGDMSFPAPWAASIVPIQIFRIGQFFLIGVPGEFTTMAGRRLRNSVRDTLYKLGLADENSYVVISGLSNEYTHYITTYQEYQVQRYEAASTLYGPHTLAAYQQEFDRLITTGLAKNVTSLPGPTPPNLNYVHWCLAECDRGPDGHPVGKPFGTVEQDVLPSYTVGQNANATFWGANLDHNFMTQSTYLTVDQLVGSQWKTILVDGHWETKLYWKKEGVDQSLVTVAWDIGSGTPPGTYRLTHQAYYKEEITGAIKPYSGTSGSFTVTA